MLITPAYAQAAAGGDANSMLMSPTICDISRWASAMPLSRRVLAVSAVPSPPPPGVFSKDESSAS